MPEIPNQNRTSIPIDQIVNVDTVLQAMLESELEKVNKFDAFMAGRNGHLTYTLAGVHGEYTKSQYISNVSLDQGNELVKIPLRAEPLSMCQDGIPVMSSQFRLPAYFNNSHVLPAKLATKVLFDIQRTTKLFVQAVLQHQRDTGGTAFEIWKNVPSKSYVSRGDCSFDLEILANQARMFMYNWLITAWLNEQPDYLKHSILQQLSDREQIAGSIKCFITPTDVKFFINQSVCKDMQAVNTGNPCIDLDLQMTNWNVQNCEETSLFRTVYNAIDLFNYNVLTHPLQSFWSDWNTNSYAYRDDESVSNGIGTLATSGNPLIRSIKSNMRKRINTKIRENCLDRLTKLSASGLTKFVYREQIGYRNAVVDKIKWPCEKRINQGINQHEHMTWVENPFRMNTHSINSFVSAAMYAEALNKYETARQKAYDNYNTKDLFNLFGNTYLINRRDAVIPTVTRVKQVLQLPYASQ